MIERVVVLFDAVSAIGFTVALFFALRAGAAGVLERGSRAFLAACMGLYVLVGISNILEHSGITAALDRFEDYAEILFLPFFLYFMYSLRTGQELHRRKEVEQEKATLIAELQAALANVKMLSGLLPICASCKKIRDDKGAWRTVEEYIRDHSEAEFSHSICPSCAKELYPDIAEKTEKKQKRQRSFAK